MVAGFAATRLRMELDRVPLWRSDRDVAVSQLVEDFARYPYLPPAQGSVGAAGSNPRRVLASDMGERFLCIR